MRVAVLRGGVGGRAGGRGREEKGGLWAAGCSPPPQRGPGGRPGDLCQDRVRVRRLGLFLHHVLRHEVCGRWEHTGQWALKHEVLRGLLLHPDPRPWPTPRLARPSHWCWMKQ